VLTPEQEYVMDLILNQEKNVFFTGSAGTCYTSPYTLPAI